MSSSRQDPWSDMMNLREAMDNLLEEHVGRHRAPGAGHVLGLAVDVREDAAAYVLTASVPGVRPAGIAVSILGDTVRICGERREDATGAAGQTGGRWLIRERHFGPFDRTVKLPTAIAAADATAVFADGVLTVTLPKAGDAGPRAIAVKPAANVARSIGIAGASAVPDD